MKYIILILSTFLLFSCTEKQEAIKNNQTQNTTYSYEYNGNKISEAEYIELISREAHEKSHTSCYESTGCLLKYAIQTVTQFPSGTTTTTTTLVEIRFTVFPYQLSCNGNIVIEGENITMILPVGSDLIFNIQDDEFGQAIEILGEGCFEKEIGCYLPCSTQ